MYNMIFSDISKERLLHFHENENIQNYFDSYYSQEIINKITNFYFHEQNLNCEMTRLENLCHVNMFTFFL